jgi:putative ABC transport system substrate-binding protein
MGIVESLARPGGNLTGFVNFEPSINTKYLQLLKDIAPSARR